MTVDQLLVVTENMRLDPEFDNHGQIIFYTNSHKKAI